MSCGDRWIKYPIYAEDESAPSDTMEARMDSMDSATDTRGSDEPCIQKGELVRGGEGWIEAVAWIWEGDSCRHSASRNNK